MTNSVTKKCVAAREENFHTRSFRELKVTERQRCVFFFFFFCFFFFFVFFFFFFFFFLTFPPSSPYFQLPPPPTQIFLKSNHWFAEALGNNVSTQAPQPTSKASNDTTPTQSTTKKGETTPTTESTTPSKFIYQFFGASNHFWAYPSAMLISKSPFKAMTNQSIFFL